MHAGCRGCTAYHLIGQDAVDAVVVEVDEPVEALHLVVAHDAMLDDGRLLAQAVPLHLHAVLEQVGVLHLLCVLGRIAPARLPAQRQAASAEDSGAAVTVNTADSAAEG